MQPGPWLVFFTSLLAGPALGVVASLLTAQVNQARVEERMTTVVARSAEADNRLDRLEAALKANDTLTAQQAIRLELMSKETENAERRTELRIANTIEAIRRIQDRLSRPTDFDPAIFRRNIE
jgi:hypothetical protein